MICHLIQLGGCFHLTESGNGLIKLLKELNLLLLNRNGLVDCLVLTFDFLDLLIAVQMEFLVDDFQLATEKKKERDDNQYRYHFDEEV